MHAGVRATRRVCQTCLGITKAQATSQRLLAIPFSHFRTISTAQDNNTPVSSTSSTPPPPPSNKSTNHTSQKDKTKRSEFETKLSSLLTTLNLSAKSRARAFSSAVKALELERKLSEVGGKINHATGYEDIERLRVTVAEREKLLLQAREDAVAHKKVYTDAVALRAASQRETNDLLQRKSTWTSADVVRFTELVQQDHQNERAEAKAKETMESCEDEVEKGFSDLMQAILERYHEEQVWSDKIRSLSTYGSLGITALNVLLFIITMLLVEPWKRKRLVEGVESRLRANTNEGHEATLASLSSLSTLLSEAQIKLDSLLAISASSPVSSTATSPDETTQAQGSEFPFSEELDGDREAELPIVPANPPPEGEREKELLIVGVAGAVAGIGISVLYGLFGLSR